MSNLNPDFFQTRRSRNGWGLLAVTLCFLIPLAALALPKDREQPIQITADQALRDEKQGVTIYSGNVKLIQGTLRIDAAKLTIYHDGPKLERVVAEGVPAHLQQLPDPDKGVVKARARSITYYQLEDRIHLEQQAQVERDGNIVTGDSINYFVDQDLFRADSTADSEDRVIVVIPPQKTPGEGQSSGNTDSQ